MRQAVLAAIGLLSVPACNSRDTTTARAAATGAAATPGAAFTAPDGPAVPAPAVPQVSKWVLDPENSSVGFVCKHASATSYSVTGNLTMHGVTKPVTLSVTASAPFKHAGGIRRGIEATTSVNRKDFGLVWEYPGEGPGIVVGDTIKITIDAELMLQAD